MIETVSVMDRSYKMKVSYGRKGGGEKLERTEQRLARIERSRPYVVRDGIKITVDDIALTADVSDHRSSAASYFPGLVESFEISTTKIFRHLCAR